MNYYMCESPFGTILLVSDGRALKQLLFVDDAALYHEPAGYQHHMDEVINQTIEQLQQWFAGERTDFDLPLAPEGTDFQQKVWQELLEIPFGETCTYGQLAESLNKPTAARAVGAANGKNPIALIIPCHRVNGANGSLTGYAFGVERKKLLLEMEAKYRTPETIA